MNRQKEKSLDGMIFDFDGVMIDSEPIHFACFGEVLAGMSIGLSREDYYSKYLGFDDHDCFAAVLAANSREAGEEKIAAMIAQKTAMVQKAFGESIKAMDGAVELVKAAGAEGVPMAVCSGGLRKEIELAARTIGVLGDFVAIVAAEDVKRGKPDPEGYRLALEKLRQATGKNLLAQRCVVVEDAPAGIEAARGAGMKVLAVTTSYEPAALAAADRIVKSLAQVTVADLRKLIH